MPALGLAWANLVTTRLQMIRTSGQERTLNVIFAPDLPKNLCPYVISTSGVSGFAQ